jgi:ligand-binding sensor domain-containing protein
VIKKLLCHVTFVSVEIIYCAAFIIAISFDVHAQEMTLRKYTAKDGLPSTYVFGAYQDKLGYLWVGSPDGLSRFDGKYFTNYGLSDGLPDTRTLGGFMDSHLRFWAYTTRGVAEFKGNKFISYPLSDSLNIRWVFQILETKQGQLWSLTSTGIYQFNFNKWCKVKLYPGYENHACRDIIETHEGLYINYGNLLLLKKNDGTFKIIGALKTSPYYYNYLSISAGEIFLSTINGMNEIVNQQLVKLKGELGSLKNNYAYYCDSKKRFWIANEQKGIQLIETGDTSHFKTIFKPKENFLPQSISEDKEGNIWVATGSGLLRFSEMGFKILEVPALTKKKCSF